MKTKMLIVTAVLLVAGSTFLLFAAAEMPKISGKEVTMTGMLSCTFCKMAHPDKTCTPDCCVNCVKAGDPMMLTDDQGGMYVLLSGEKGMSMKTPERIAMMGGQVTVKGMQVKQGGIQAIYVNSMEKAEAKQMTMTGKLSCSFCKLAHPDMTCTPECCASCIKAGDPPLLTDAQGGMYILISGEKEKALMTPQQQTELMGSQVSVKGLVVSRNGMKAIFVDSIEKAKAM